MENTNTPKSDNPTLEHYPQMLQTAKTLVINHNILRYHTYDVFTRLLLERSEFDRIVTTNPSVVEFVKMPDPIDRLRWAYTQFTPEFCLSVFGSREHYSQLLKEYLTDEKTLNTPTALSYGIGNIFNSDLIAGAVLIQKGDKPPSKENTTFSIYSTDDIFDVDSLIKFIISAGFNSVFVDSVQLAAELSYHTEGVTFMIPTYRFNFNNDGKFLGMEHLTLTELNNKNEFGIFHPYTFTKPQEETINAYM